MGYDSVWSQLCYDLQGGAEGRQRVAVPARGEEGCHVVVQEAALEEEVGEEGGWQLEQHQDQQGEEVVAAHTHLAPIHDAQTPRDI